MTDKSFIVLWDNEQNKQTFHKLVDAARQTKELIKSGIDDAYFKHREV